MLAAALPALGGVSAARAGTVIVSRHSYIRAAGGPGPGGFDLSNGTNDFGRFADDISNGPGGSATASVPSVSEAHQYSVPGVMDSGFGGAYAEGSVRANVVGPGSTATAVSNFDLTFRVVGSPAQYTVGAAMGTAGSGTVTAELVNVAGGAGGAGVASPARSPAGTAAGAGGAGESVFLTRLAPGRGDSQTIDKSGVLGPGLYALRVYADSSGTTDSSSAYYNVNLTITPGTATAVPLPAAAWTGAAVLAGVAGIGAMRRRRWAGERA